MSCTSSNGLPTYERKCARTKELAQVAFQPRQRPNHPSIMLRDHLDIARSRCRSAVTTHRCLRCKAGQIEQPRRLPPNGNAMRNKYKGSVDNIMRTTSATEHAHGARLLNHVQLLLAHGLLVHLKPTGLATSSAMLRRKLQARRRWPVTPFVMRFANVACTPLKDRTEIAQQVSVNAIKSFFKQI